jgi:hypothetical protein
MDTGGHHFVISEQITKLTQFYISGIQPHFRPNKVVSKSNITETSWKNTHTKTNYKLQYWSGVHSMVTSNIYSTSLFQDMNSTVVVTRRMKTQWKESQHS